MWFMSSLQKLCAFVSQEDYLRAFPKVVSAERSDTMCVFIYWKISGFIVTEAEIQHEKMQSNMNIANNRKILST